MSNSLEVSADFKAYLIQSNEVGSIQNLIGEPLDEIEAKEL